jgi:hypothetical protein
MSNLVTASEEVVEVLEGVRGDCLEALTEGIHRGTIEQFDHLDGLTSSILKVLKGRSSNLLLLEERALHEDFHRDGKFEDGASYVVCQSSTLSIREKLLTEGDIAAGRRETFLQARCVIFHEGAYPEEVIAEESQAAHSDDTGLDWVLAHCNRLALKSLPVWIAELRLLTEEIKVREVTEIGVALLVFEVVNQAIQNVYGDALKLVKESACSAFNEVAVHEILVLLLDRDIDFVKEEAAICAVSLCRGGGLLGAQTNNNGQATCGGSKRHGSVTSLGGKQTRDRHEIEGEGYCDARH